MTTSFLPEGRLLHTQENQNACAGAAGLVGAMERREILEGQAILCDSDHNLTVSLGEFTGVIPRQEAALGIEDGSTRDIAILTRVGKPVCFTVEQVENTAGRIRPILSRRKAQSMALQNAMDTWEPGRIIPATVTHLEPFGAFVDIGCGVSSMIGIENISVSRISHPRERFSQAQEIFAVVSGLDRPLNRVLLSHKELLGTWEENAKTFSPGMTVTGYVRSVKEYGLFVELTPNLSGLAEVQDGIREGDRVSVYIKAILPERMKIKLLIIDRLPPAKTPEPFSYYLTGGTLASWRYAPEGCSKVGGETVFQPKLGNL